MSRAKVWPRECEKWKRVTKLDSLNLGHDTRKNILALEFIQFEEGGKVASYEGSCEVSL